MNERDSETVKIMDVAAAKLVEATLYEGVTQKNLRAHKVDWVPQLVKANSEAGKTQSPIVAEDARWNWGKKVEKTKGQLAFRHFAIEYGTQTIGLMLLRLVGQQSRIEVPKDLVYIDFLAVCPEARKEIQDPRKYGGIGKILFMAAVLVSKEEDMDGRVGLHSLPKARQWYEKELNLNKFGPDPTYNNLEYFELSTKRAQQLINEMN